MARHVSDRHYQTLTPHERFVLLIEAMARRDDIEADRLEDTCPKFTYRGEDQEFRDRMRRLYMIASRVALSLEGPLAQLRLMQAFHEHAAAFSEPITHLAQTAFLYGREYGKWEAGAIVQVDLPDDEVIAKEVAEKPDLELRLRELEQLGEETLADILDDLRGSVANVHAKKTLPQWRDFRRFCSETLGAEPTVVMSAFGLMSKDPEEAFSALGETLPCGEGEVNKHSSQWASWLRRFPK